MKFALLLIATLLSPFTLAKDYYVGDISGETIMADFKKFKKHADDVDYSAEQLASLQSVEDKIEIKVFFGQWCHDSQREVPRLIQLFDRLEKDNFSVSYYALDTKKSDPEGLAKQHRIKRTPTVIVFKDGKELARVLEFPQTDWPSDLAEIITK